MKILHLADLHLGKILQEQSLLEDQEYMLKEIIKIIKEEKVEIIRILHQQMDIDSHINE